MVLTVNPCKSYQTRILKPSFHCTNTQMIKLNKGKYFHKDFNEHALLDR